MKTKFHRLSDICKEKRVMFTHTLTEEGDIMELDYPQPSEWSDVMLLDGKRGGLYQYLVWNEKDKMYFIFFADGLFV